MDYIVTKFGPEALDGFEEFYTSQRAPSNLPWVYDVGVNTTDIELFGERYTGYVWVHLSHFSTYGVGGLTNNQPPDVSQAYPNVEYLWPPNRDLVNVIIEGVIDPDRDNVTITITGISTERALGELILFPILNY